MALPPGFLDELRTRTSLSQVVGRKVMWDTRKSNQGKGDMWSPCPFHQEKTASFHVDDRKGFYYCFGCHAKGDAISFIRETENVGFMEAVEILARESGMPVPKQDPQAQKKADHRTVLADIMEQAVQYYRLQLKTAVAGTARDYLDRRGLKQETQDRFDIGFAPDTRQGLFQHLTGKGVDPALIVDAGLCAKPDDGGAPYDRFRNRILFPIRDPRGRCIALGGRAMDPNARAKYLNSPETALFDKGRSLYNQGPARTAAGKGQTLVVAEGYMDVIALAEAGFGACVAPLGTAITESQLHMLWRISPEPIIALDGDTAGLRAAMRLIDLALPLLEAGQSLRFAIMPQGQDPDDVVRSGGKGAMQALVDGAIPMVNLLWRRETDDRNFDSPERKAMLDKVLREKIKLIKDRSIRQHYGDAIKQMRWELFRPSNWSEKFRPKKKGTEHSRQETRRSQIAQDRSNRIGERLREMIILAVLMKHPDIVSQFEDDLETFDLLEDGNQEFLFVILSHYSAESDEMLYARVVDVVGITRVERIMKSPHVVVNPAIVNPDDHQLAISTLIEQLAKLKAERDLREAIEEGTEDIEGFADEFVTWRLAQAASAQAQAQHGESEDTTEYEIADNGVRINREERGAFEALMAQIKQQKP